VASGNIGAVNGLTINGTATLGDATGTGYIRFVGSQTLGGTGNVVFGSAAPGNALSPSVANSTLTLAQGITVHGAQGSIGYNPNIGGATNVSIVNLGTINADVTGRTIQLEAVSTLNSGNLKATGGILNIIGDLGNAGTLSPSAGASGGATAVSGNFTQTPAGNLIINIGGLTAGTQFGQLNVSGSATLAGTVAVKLVNSFVPTAGNNFQFLTCGSHTGTFDLLSDLDPADGIVFTPTYSATNVKLTAAAGAAIPASATETLVPSIAKTSRAMPAKVTKPYLFSTQPIGRQREISAHFGKRWNGDF